MGGETVCNKCVYVCGIIPPVFWYNYPNYAPQGAPQAPQEKRSQRVHLEGWSLAKTKTCCQRTALAHPVRRRCGAIWCVLPHEGWLVAVWLSLRQKKQRKGFAMPTGTTVHGDALCFMVKTWAPHRTTEAVLNSGWRLAVGGWWGLSLRAVLNRKKPKKWGF